MARNRNRQFAKRKRELEKKEKKAQKRERKAARASSPNGPEIMDIEDAPTSYKPSDDEVMRAVERAMRPQNAGAREARGRASANPRLFVGNLHSDVEENELRAFFIERGFPLNDAIVPRDRNTGESRGFAFVELAEADKAPKAIEALDGFTFQSRQLRVNAAEPR